MVRKLAIVFLIIFANSCAQRSKIVLLCKNSLDVNNIPKISFNELYTSNGLDRKIINIEGRFSYNFEDIALYPIKHSLNQKGIWLSFDENLLRNDTLLVKLNGQKIVVIGTIDLSDKGHLNSYYCALVNIVCIKEL